MRTDGSDQHVVRQIEFLSPSETFGVKANGSCDWLKKKLTLAYGAPVRSDEWVDHHYRQKEMHWQVQKTSLVISYSEGASESGDMDLGCGLKAEVIE